VYSVFTLKFLRKDWIMQS